MEIDVLPHATVPDSYRQWLVFHFKELVGERIACGSALHIKSRASLSTLYTQVVAI